MSTMPEARLGLRVDNPLANLERTVELYREAAASGDWSAVILDIRYGVSHVQLKDMGVLVEAEQPRAGRVDAGTQEYLRYLAKKMMLGLVVLISCAVVAWFAAMNLTFFLRYEIALFHPAISVYLLVASVGLAAVAIASICTGWRHVRKTIWTL